MSGRNSPHKDSGRNFSNLRTKELSQSQSVFKLLVSPCSKLLSSTHQQGAASSHLDIQGVVGAVQQGDFALHDFHFLQGRPGQATGGRPVRHLVLLLRLLRRTHTRLSVEQLAHCFRGCIAFYLSVMEDRCGEQIVTKRKCTKPCISLTYRTMKS